MNATCLACDLTSGDRELPGGRIRQTRYWVVEHCVGPLGVGTLVVKPARHCVYMGALTLPEALDLGPLLAQAARCVQELTNAEQVYVCLWSHAGWSPQHILCLPLIGPIGSSRPPQIFVMEPTNAGHLHHPALARWLHTPRLRRVLSQR
jgi:hypothetical protein